jgi:hypothetical protein
MGYYIRYGKYGECADDEGKWAEWYQDRGVVSTPLACDCLEWREANRTVTIVAER